MQTATVAIALAHREDAPAVATLHAESWRRHYRGAYSDHYLDGDLDAERLALWKERLGRSDGATFTLLAQQDDRLVGFVHARLDAEPYCGTLIDNLHVTHELQRRRVGSRLMDRAARYVLEQRPGQGIHLWVLEQNRSAQTFYLSRGGQICARELVPAPGGETRNLNGTPFGLKVAWPDPSALVLADQFPETENQATHEGPAQERP
jgi:ribosomal protein S18 acetylase RimI-like enzyme